MRTMKDQCFAVTYTDSHCNLDDALLARRVLVAALLYCQPRFFSGLLTVDGKEGDCFCLRGGFIVAATLLPTQELTS